MWYITGIWININITCFLVHQIYQTNEIPVLRDNNTNLEIKEKENKIEENKKIEKEKLKEEEENIKKKVIEELLIRNCLIDLKMNP